MALISCPGCAGEVSDMAAACPGCGCPIKEDVYTGSLSGFGFKRLLAAESDNYYTGWRHGRRRDAWRRQAQADRRIDTSKKKILSVWALGLLGTLGFHYFAAGRYISGALRFLYGALVWTIIIGVMFSSDSQEAEYKWGIIQALAVLLLLPPFVYDILFIGLGRFRDAFRNFIA